MSQQPPHGVAERGQLAAPAFLRARGGVRQQQEPALEEAQRVLPHLLHSRRIASHRIRVAEEAIEKTA